MRVCVCMRFVEKNEIMKNESAEKINASIEN
jgi:hypothetical protein